MCPTFRLNLRQLSSFTRTCRQISTRFCLTENMNRGTVEAADRGSSSSPSGNSAILLHHVADTSSPGKNSSHTERNKQGKFFASEAYSKSKEFDCRPSSHHIMRKVHSSDTTSIGLSSKHGCLNKRSRVDLGLEVRTKDMNSSPNEILPMKSFTSDQDISLPTQFGKKSIPSYSQRSMSCQSYFKSAATECLPKVKPFDICMPRCRIIGVSKSPLHEEDEEIQNIVEHTIEESRQQVLQPGMVLLKQYITHNQQLENQTIYKIQFKICDCVHNEKSNKAINALDDEVKIVNTCRELGLGPGGFYTPGYQDGAKLQLQMMCLGLNWDPQMRKYEDHRPIDGCKAPDIPSQFILLVNKAIKDAHTLIRTDIKQSNAEDMLPAMSPNICIVNFYTTSGRLGLHQDRDESSESLRKGLPVVSFSVGDSAEFLYGDQRDMNKAEKLVLESGDVLIFGGKSRHIFHGVTSIIPDTTPKALLEETGIRPGRLNLTFRQF